MRLENVVLSGPQASAGVRLLILTWVVFYFIKRLDDIEARHPNRPTSGFRTTENEENITGRRTVRLLHQGVNDGVRVERLQVGVGLAGADEHDRLAGDVGHGYGGADLVVDCVELGEDYPVDDVRVGGGAVVGQRLVELDELVHGLVADERLAHEQHQVGRVDLRAGGGERGALGRGDVGGVRRTLMSLASARMSGSLSCMRPAVSTSTTSARASAAARTASAAMAAASLP